MRRVTENEACLNFGTDAAISELLILKATIIGWIGKLKNVFDLLNHRLQSTERHIMDSGFVFRLSTSGYELILTTEKLKTYLICLWRGEAKKAYCRFPASKIDANSGDLLKVVTD